MAQGLQPIISKNEIRPVWACPIPINLNNTSRVIHSVLDDRFNEYKNDKDL